MVGAPSDASRKTHSCFIRVAVFGLAFFSWIALTPRVASSQVDNPSTEVSAEVPPDTNAAESPAQTEPQAEETNDATVTAQGDEDPVTEAADEVDANLEPVETELPAEELSQVAALEESLVPRAEDLLNVAPLPNSRSTS